MITREVRDGSGSVWGGSGLYAWLAAGRATHAGLASVVGTDFTAWHLLPKDRQCVRQQRGWATSKASIERDGSARLLTTAFPPLDLQPDLRCDVLVLGAMPPDWARSASETVQNRIILVDSATGWLRTHPSVYRRLASLGAIFALTQSEWSTWDVYVSPSRPVLGIVKLGPSGIQVRSGDSVLDARAPEVDDEIDDTGCGDVLLGGLAAGLVDVCAPSVEDVAAAYRAATPLIVAKLRSIGAEEFGLRIGVIDE